MYHMYAYAQCVLLLLVDNMPYLCTIAYGRIGLNHLSARSKSSATALATMGTCKSDVGCSLTNVRIATMICHLSALHPTHSLSHSNHVNMAPVTHRVPESETTVNLLQRQLYTRE